MPAHNTGTSVTEALRLLMLALQNEADPFIKLLHIFSKGGQGWEEMKQTIDRVYDTVYPDVPPSDEPQESETAPTSEQDKSKEQ